MNSFFGKRDPWGNSLSTWVLVAMAFLLPFAWWSVRQVDLENDVEHWLPANDPQSRALHWYHTYFPENDRILISWEGSTPDDPRFDRLADLLRGETDAEGIRRSGSPYVESVLTPDDMLAQMGRRGISRSEGLERLAGVLIGKGPLYVRYTTAGEGDPGLTRQLVAEAASRAAGVEVRVLDRLAEQSTAIPEAAAVTSPPQNRKQAEATPFEFPRHDLRLLWHGMHAQPEQMARVREALGRLTGTGTDNPARLVEDSAVWPGSPVAMTATFTEAGSLETTRALAQIREFATEAGIPAEAISFGGRPIVAEELNQQVKRVAWDRSAPVWNLGKRSALLLCAFVGAVLACVMLRSFRLATVVLISALYTTILAVAVVPVSDGNMNMVLVVMPALLMVLTISAAIHVANYWKHAAARDPRTAVISAYRMALQPCLLASLTTALGLLSLLTSPLSPVSEFGLYAAIGCLILMVVVLYGLPSMLQHWPARVLSVQSVNTGWWHQLADRLVHHRRVVTVLFLAGFGISAWGLMYFHTETKVIRYLPPESKVVADYNTLEDQLAGVVPVELVIAFDAAARDRLNFLERTEIVRQVQQEMQTHSEISGTMSLADFQPVSRPPAAGASLFERAGYNRRAFETQDQVRQALDKGAGSLYAIATGDRELAHATGHMSCHRGDELWRITAQTAIMSDVDYGDLTSELGEMVRTRLENEEGVGHCVTGMVPLFLRTQQAVLDSLIRSFALAFGMIALVMMAVLRNPLAGIITMLPNVLPVGVVFGIISWLGIPVDLGTMITASVGLGIAVDGTLHLLTWFREGLILGCDRTEAIRRALGHCGPAMWQTSAVVGVSLLMLAPADLLLVSRFGWLMAALIGAALLADIVLLPALLAGSLGALIEKSVRNRKPAHQSQSADRMTGPVIPQPHMAVSGSRSRAAVSMK